MRLPLTCGIVAACLSAPRLSVGQQPAQPSRDTSVQAPDSILENGVSAGEADAEPRRRRLVKWNEYEGPYFTLRFGAGLLVDYATYDQNEVAKGQVKTTPGFKLRDSRLIFGGRVKTKRRITYQAGFMYDGYIDEWFVRQTGVMFAVPELWGHLWIGRSKEGPSLNRVMVGYDGWTMERFTFSDAAIPLLADGIKWLGYLPNRHLIWNLGVFTDWLSEEQSFSYYDYQVAGRVAWVPMVSDSAGKLLHIGASFQVGKPDDGSLQLKSKPEASDAPNFIDTGKFPATSAFLTGIEAYYRPGPWLFGTEYYLEKASSAEAGNPLFHGGDIAATWLVTGETRSYNTVGGYFRGVSPRKTVFEGGPGAVELVLRFSYSDLNGGNLQGGTFWRLTPMVNWHLSDHVRLELAYGYGKLDRFAVKGTTQFFQTRLQLEF
jgi:phosphate-selective porin OprO and OprP